MASAAFHALVLTRCSSHDPCWIDQAQATICSDVSTRFKLYVSMDQDGNATMLAAFGSLADLCASNCDSGPVALRNCTTL